MTSQKNTTRVALEPANIDRIQMLCGPFDDNLKQIEKRLSVSIDYNLNEFEITGSDSGCNAAKTVLQKLYVDTAPIKGEAQDITPTQVNLALVESRILDQNDDDNDEDNPYSVQYGNLLCGRTENNRNVNFEGPDSLIGTLADVEITEVMPHSLKGKLVVNK